MKIINITTDYLPNIGGIAAHVHHLSKALANLGHQIFIIHIQDGKEKDKISEESKDNGITIFTVVNDESKSKLVRLLNRTWLIIKVYKVIVAKYGEIDLIHQHDHRSTNLALQLLKYRNNWFWTNHSSGFLEDYEKKYLKYLLKILYEGVNGIIGVSEERKEKPQNLFGSKPIYKHISNGVDLEKFQPDKGDEKEYFKDIDSNEFVVLCPSRMVPVKGVIYLAKAINKIITEEPDVPWKFVFIGSEKAFNTDNNYIKKIRQIIDYNGVVYLGNVPMDKMPTVYKIADLVVMPSLMEAVSLSALEAMATKKPLITTNIGGFPEIIKQLDTGIMVPPRDSQALAKAIIKLYRDNALREQIAINGYELVKSRYSWDKVAEKTDKFYKEVLSLT